MVVDRRELKATIARALTFMGARVAAADDGRPAASESLAAAPGERA